MFSTLHEYLPLKVFRLYLDERQAFRKRFIFKVLRIQGSTSRQNFIAVETNQVLKSVNFHLKNYVGETQKFNIFKNQSIVSSRLETLKTLSYEKDCNISQVLSNRLYHYIEQFGFLEKSYAQKCSK